MTMQIEQLKLPMGLVNLGNTCYLNATLQCLRAVPELKTIFEKYELTCANYLSRVLTRCWMVNRLPKSLGADTKANMVVALGTLFKELETAGDSVPPLVFLQVPFYLLSKHPKILLKTFCKTKLLRTVFPQFAERDASGFLQQDAEEAWGQIVYTLNEKLPGLNQEGELHSTKKFVDQFMTVETTVT
jgi:ubiquitin carboxyl-terminal hydrolase 14